MSALRHPPVRVWVWTAATLALVVAVSLLWRSSDAAATDRSTASPAAAPTGSPAGELSEAWSRRAAVLPEQVVADGRVVVGERHGITALDPRTGRQAWHYDRSNAVLCGMTAVDDVVVAVFRTDVRCDEAVALHADTGGYAWTRSVDFDSAVRLASTHGSVVAVSRGSVVVIDPVGDNIRWRTDTADCAVLDAAAGSSGIAVVLRCTGTDVLRVRLLEAGQGKVVWTRDLPTGDSTQVALAGADQGVAVVVGDELQLLAAADGTATTTVPLPAAGAAEPHPLSTAIGPVVAVWARGTLVVHGGDPDAVLWTVAALGLPTSVDTLGADVLSAPLLVPEDRGFVARDASTGAEVGRSGVDGLAAGGVATPVGEVVVYRLPDRVSAYR